MRYKNLIFALIIFLIPLLSGCRATNEKIKVPQENYPTVVRNITINKSPLSVISLSPSLTELIYEFGYQNTVVARTSETKFPKQVLNLPSIGSGANPNIQKIIDIGPDVLLSNSPLAKKDVDLLSKAKIKLLVIPMAKNIEELEKIYKDIADLYEGKLNGPKKSEQVFSPISKYINELTDKIKQKSTFLYIIDLDGTIATTNTYESSILSLFAENVANYTESYTADISELKLKNPQIIFLSKPYYKEHLERDSKYKGFTTIKNSKIITIDKKLFEIQSSRIIESIKTLENILIPDVINIEQNTMDSSK